MAIPSSGGRVGTGSPRKNQFLTLRVHRDLYQGWGPRRKKTEEGFGGLDWISGQQWLVVRGAPGEGWVSRAGAARLSGLR